MDLWNWILSWFRPPLSTREMVAEVFPVDVREFATAFYESWEDQAYLLVELGDGYGEAPDREAFFRTAFFYFSRHPTGADGYWALGIHAEGTESIVIETETGRIFYYSSPLDYDSAADDVVDPELQSALRAAARRADDSGGRPDPDLMTELAGSFPEFIAELEQRGWHAPPRASAPG